MVKCKTTKFGSIHVLDLPKTSLEEGPRLKKIVRIADKRSTSKHILKTLEFASKNAAMSLTIPKRSTKIGDVLVCGQGSVGQLGLGESVSEKTRPTLLSDVEDVVDVCAGGMHSLCLTKQGEIYSFGCNDEGALGRDTSEEGSEFTPAKVIGLPKKAIKLSCGDSHSACLLEDGSVFAW